MIYLAICGFIIIISLSSCATTQIKNEDAEIKEKKQIFKVYDNNIPNSIILAYERLYKGTFDIAKNYLQYNKETNNSTYDGFWIWLTKNLWYKDIFDKGDEFGIGKWIIDNRINNHDYQEIKKNYELLERMYDEK